MYSLTFYIFTRIYSEEREDIKIGKNRPAIQNTQQHLMLFECIKVLNIKIKSQNFFWETMRVQIRFIIQTHQYFEGSTFILLLRDDFNKTSHYFVCLLV